MLDCSFNLKEFFGENVDWNDYKRDRDIWNGIAFELFEMFFRIRFKVNLKQWI